MVLTWRREMHACFMTLDPEEGDKAGNGKFTVSTK